MDDIWVSEKARNILKILLEWDEPVSISFLEEKSKLSRRMVNYGIEEIRYIFKKLQIGDLKIENSDVFLTSTQKEKYREWLPLKYCFQTKEDRIYYIICSILCSKKNIWIKSLMEVFDISKNAVLYNLRQARDIFTEYNIQLKTSKKGGYYAEGDVLNKRMLFLKCISRLTANIEYQCLDIFDVDKAYKYLKCTERICGRLNIFFSTQEKNQITFLMVAIDEMPGEPPLELMDLEYVESSTEWKIIAEEIPELTYTEKIYLTVIFMDYQKNHRYILENRKVEEKLEVFVRILIESFDRLICVDDFDKNELHRDILQHIKMSYYRYCFMIPQNFILEKSIRSQYSDLYSIVLRIYREAKEYCPFVMDEGELAYLTIYFATMLLKSRERKNKVNVLICCNHNIASSKLLYVELGKLFENIHVVGMISLQEVKEYVAEDIVHFVIATDKVDCQYPLLIVNPILSDEDKANIQTYIALFGKNIYHEKSQLQTFLQIVKKYVNMDVYQNIKEEIQQYLNMGGSLIQINENRTATLVDMMETYGVQIIDEKISWETALRCTAEPLVRGGCIEPGFVEAIFQLLETYGPYFVITDEIAVVHARPEVGVHRLGLTLSVCRKGIQIKQYPDVKLLFVLATPNNKEQISIIKNILELSEDEEAVSEVICAKQEEEVLYVFHELFDK